MEPVFDYILRHATEEGDLPEDFRLPDDFRRPGGAIRMLRPPGADCRAALNRLVEQLMACDKPEKGMELVASAAAQYPADIAAGCLEKSIQKRISIDNLHKLLELGRIGVWIAMNATEVECLKYGLVLCKAANVTGWSKAAEDIILTLVLCEEFTEFAMPCLNL